MKKKLLSLVTCLSLCVSLGSIPAYAAGSSTASGTLCNSSISASVSKTSSSATAKTSWNYSGGTRYAEVTIYYWLDSTYYYSKASGSDSLNTGYATVSKKVGGADVLGASGVHKVTYSSYTWQDTTVTGSVPSSLSGWVYK